jgi:hypothetical protein
MSFTKTLQDFGYFSPKMLLIYRDREREGEEELQKLKKSMETEHTNYKTNAEAQIGILFCFYLQVYDA